MNILVISNVRCGGRYFTKYLAEKYNLKLYHQPIQKTVQIINKKNTCIKILPCDFTIEYIKQLVTEFDYVFVLDRQDKKKQLESMIVLNEITGNMYSKWDWKEKYSDVGKGYFYWDTALGIYKTILKKVADEIGKKIIYYEDVYYGNNVDILEGLKFTPNLSDKLRISRSEQLI
jgi:hypothetical protein